MNNMTQQPWRPRWYWWTAYVLSLFVIFVAFAVVSALTGLWNPYLFGLVAMSGAGLRVTWWATKKERRR